MIADTDCVDAVGFNSTPAQLADAQLSIRLPSIFTGDLVTQDEDHRALGGTDEFLPSKNRDVLISSFYDQVPPGGDAAFASAACDLKGGWSLSYIWNDGVTDRATAETMGRTPHFVRSLGRHVCWAMPGGGGEGIVAPIKLSDVEKHTEEIRSNPQAWKDKMVAEVDSSVAGITIDNPAVKQAFEANQQRRRDKIANTSPADLVTAAEQYYQLLVAAHKHQCPQLQAD